MSFEAVRLFGIANDAAADKVLDEHAFAPLIGMMLDQPQRVAPEASLVIVKTDLMDAHIADGIRYIFRVADERKVIVIGPQFEARHWPKAAGYNAGDVKEQPDREKWAFAAIEHIFDDLCQRGRIPRDGFERLVLPVRRVALRFQERVERRVARDRRRHDYGRRHADASRLGGTRPRGGD